MNYDEFFNSLLALMVGLATTFSLLLAPSAGQQPPPAEIDRMMDTLRDDVPALHKWSDGAPVQVVIVTLGQTGPCVDMTVAKIRQELAVVREMVPALRNVRDPVVLDRLPVQPIDMPLLISLDSVDDTIGPAMQRFARQTYPNAREFVRRNRWGEGFMLDRGLLVITYSWILSDGNLADAPLDICRSLTWYEGTLLQLLGAQGFLAVNSPWMPKHPYSVVKQLVLYLKRLYLKALYFCPASPADRDCVRRKLLALADATPFKAIP
ncbi:MAG: hypothetical protein ACOY4R_20370 [Pseudomonadota bacterium]